jgi:exosome complex component RRP42
MQANKHYPERIFESKIFSYNKRYCGGRKKMNTVISKIRRKQILQSIKSGKRLNDRGLTDYRAIQIEAGFIEKAEGSARVRLGKTEVLVGIKIEIGKPFSDRPNEGVLTTNAELTPLASPEYEPGPPKENTIELARVIDRGIRESQAINLQDLCLIPGKKVFVVFIDIYVLNYDGNLFDASALAALVALMNTKVFKYEIKNEEIEKKLGFTQLPVKSFPLATTLVEINGQLIVDPGLEEEEILDARITITYDQDGKICAIQKGGREALTLEQIIEAASIAKEKTAELRKLVVKSK